MNTPYKRMLWIDVEPSHVLAERLEETVKNAELDENIKELSKLAAQRIRDQQQQISSLIMNMMNTVPPAEVVNILLKCGFSRHELASCWGVSKEHLIMLESAKKPL